MVKLFSSPFFKAPSFPMCGVSINLDECLMIPRVIIFESMVHGLEKLLRIVFCCPVKAHVAGPFFTAEVNRVVSAVCGFDCEAEP